MNSTFYLSRSLSNNETIYTEEALLAASNYIVVLAEPGGGKTELMKMVHARTDGLSAFHRNRITNTIQF